MNTLPELYYKQTIIKKDVVVTAGENYSGMVDCGGMQLVAISTPPIIEATQINFYVNFVPDFATSRPITYIDNTSYLITSSSSPNGHHYPLVPHYFIGAPYIWVFVNSAPTSDLTLSLALQPIFQGIHA